MQLSHKRRAVSASFDDPNLVSAAGLVVPVVALAESAGLRDLADKQLSVPADKGANAGWKVMSLVAGMVAGADSIDDMDVLRHGGMRSLFEKIYAPSTLGSFLRGFTFGHVRQLDAVASRFLGALAARTPPLVGLDEGGEYVMVDIDDTIIEVHGYTKQGSGYGYSGVCGINAAIVTVSTKQAAPVIIAQRMRKGAANSARGASRLVADALSNLKKLRSPDTLGKVLLRADSAFYGYPTIGAAITAGTDVSVTARLDPAVKAAIGAIGQDAWEKIEQVPGRLVVRRIPDLNTQAKDGQAALFDSWRFHAFFTTSGLDAVEADKTHRQHAVIEQVHADLKNSALAHLPSKSFAANRAWLVLAVIAFNLTRAAATLTGPTLARATTATIRRKVITVPARIAASARRIVLHLPTGWPWERPWADLFTATGCGPPRLTPA